MRHVDAGHKAVATRVEATTILRQEHDELRAGVRALMQAMRPMDRLRLFESLMAEFRAHARAEEDVLYPAFRAAASRRRDVRALEVLAAEHRMVDDLLDTLDAGEFAARGHAATTKTLADLIERHAQAQESTFFARARHLLGRTTLLDLAPRLLERKRALRRAGALVA